VIDEFEKRKIDNFEKLRNDYYIEARSRGKGLRGDIPITTNAKTDVITGCFCSYCKEYLIKENPWKTGVYIFPTCRKCLQYVGVIESYLSNKKGVCSTKIRRTMSDPTSVDIDWALFEKLMKNGQAKLSLLSEKYNLYSSEIKELIVNKYENRVDFKKGRYGGIFWSHEPGKTKG